MAVDDNLTLTPVAGDPFKGSSQSQSLGDMDFSDPVTAANYKASQDAQRDALGRAALKANPSGTPESAGLGAAVNAMPTDWETLRGGENLAQAAGDPTRPMYQRVGSAIGAEGYNLGVGMLSSAYGAATLPGDVALGKIDPSSSDAIRRSTDLAGMLTMPAATSSAVDPNALGIFAGARAKTADLEKLAQAQDMAAKGEYKTDIYDKTGWFTGADGKWRFEIPDDTTTINPKVVPYSPYRNAAVGDVFDHPELYKAYPDIKQQGMVNRNVPEGAIASYQYDPARPFPEQYSLSHDAVLNEGTGRSAMLHELQHAVQQREGFEGGANPSQFQGNVPNPLRSDYPSDPAELTPYDLYNQTAGEVEARNVQKRRNWSDDRRSDVPPWFSQDVPTSRQIVGGAIDGRPLQLTPVQGNPFQDDTKFASIDPSALKTTTPTAPLLADLEITPPVAKNSVYSKRNPDIYKAPNVVPRPFEADYPNGANHNESGSLSSDIEGRPLIADYVAGRQMVGGPDEGLSSSRTRDVGGGLGAQFFNVKARTIGGDAGRLNLERSSGGSYPTSRIDIDAGLPSNVQDLVASHEVSHLIDKLSGTIDTSGLNSELRTVYNTLNNPQEYGSKLGPENLGYKGLDIHRELMAEAIRAYMQNPNYLKTVAPKSAAAIRDAVNANPRLSKTIQFNSAGIPFSLMFIGSDEDQNSRFRLTPVQGNPFESAP